MIRRLLVAALALAAPLLAQPRMSLFTEVDGIVRTLSEITGWQVRRKVPSEIVTRESFRKSVEDHTKGKSAEKEIRAEELALKMFGLVPQDFSLTCWMSRRPPTTTTRRSGCLFWIPRPPDQNSAWRWCMSWRTRWRISSIRWGNI
jgi:hypothetical protein